MNVYEYAYGNPMLYIDEKGEFANLIIGGAIGFGFDLMAQLMQNGGNWKCVNVKQLAISTAFGMIGGFAGGKGLSSGLSKLSIKTKGKIGESLSLINNRLKLSKLVARNEMTIPGHRTIVDSTWRSLDGSLYYVESKFGKSQLSRLQKKAYAVLGPEQYRIERWDYAFFGRIGAYTGGSGAVGFNRLTSADNCDCN